MSTMALYRQDFDFYINLAERGGKKSGTTRSGEYRRYGAMQPHFWPKRPYVFRCMRTRYCIKQLPVSPTPVCSNYGPYLFLLTFTCHVIILSIGSVKQVHCAQRPQSRPMGCRLNCDRHVARSGKTRNSHKILVGKSEGTTPLSKTRRYKIFK